MAYPDTLPYTATPVNGDCTICSPLPSLDGRRSYPIASVLPCRTLVGSTCREILTKPTTMKRKARTPQLTVKLDVTSLAHSASNSQSTGSHRDHQRCHIPSPGCQFLGGKRLYCSISVPLVASASLFDHEYTEGSYRDRGLRDQSSGISPST